ncbi:hypothetical protein ACC755_37455, partial [Rhizobium ruizarguesonis]
MIRLRTLAAEHEALSPPFRRKQRDEEKDSTQEFVENKIGRINFRLCAPAMDRRVGLFITTLKEELGTVRAKTAQFLATPVH